MKFKFSHLKYLFNHPLAQRRLIKTFYRYIYFHLRYRNNDEIVIPYINNKLIIKKGQGGQSNYFTELEDYEEMLFLAHYINKEDTFIDIGANVGAYTILVAITNGANIHAFEPNSIFFNILLKNIELNNFQKQITTYHCALGEKNGFSYILKRGALSRIIDSKNKNTEKVELKRLDDIIDSANVIKIDVEGYEENVLKGAEKILIQPQLNAIIIEMAGFDRYGSSDYKVNARLSQFGFHPVHYNPQKRILNIRENYLKEREGFKNVIYVKDIDLAIKRIRSSDMIYINGRTY